MAVPTAPAKLNPDVLLFARESLPRVSRTFALTIPVLREPLRTYVMLSYLLCRIVDTVEDHPDLDRAQRDERFQFLLLATRGGASSASWGEFLAGWPEYPQADYEELVQHAPELFLARQALPDAITGAVDNCLVDMIEGMAGFPSASRPPAEACADLEELDRYCHAVAGTVGILLSRLFAENLAAGWLDEDCLERGRRFGLGLQFVNVLKDHMVDRERGISFLPRRYLTGKRAGAPLTSEGLREVALHAVSHLDEGHRYILGIPSESADLRVFCLWAHHLAISTLRVLGQGITPPKVDRAEVMVITSAARDAAGDSAALEELYRGYRNQAVRSFAG